MSRVPDHESGIGAEQTARVTALRSFLFNATMLAILLAVFLAAYPPDRFKLPAVPTASEAVAGVAVAKVAA